MITSDVIKTYQKSGLKEHKRTYLRIKYNYHWSQCSASFSNRKYFDLQIKEHKRLYKYKCDNHFSHCNYKRVDKKRLSKHEVSHSSDRPLSCGHNGCKQS